MPEKRDERGGRGALRRFGKPSPDKEKAGVVREAKLGGKANVCMHCEGSHAAVWVERQQHAYCMIHRQGLSILN